MKKRIFRWWAGNDACERELEGANRFYTGNDIYAYPYMPNRMSSFFANKGLVAEIVSIDTILGTESIVKEFVFVDPKIDKIDKKSKGNAEVVEFDNSQYEVEYEEKHNAWVKECEEQGFYSEANDLERC